MSRSKRGWRRNTTSRTASFDPLEGRDLPSIAPLLYAAQAAAAGAATAVKESSLISSDQSPPGNLTPHELARERFSAFYAGSVLFGPGRTTDQLSQAFFVGPMTSSAFFQGHLVMAIFTPTDPTQPWTGQAALIVRNVVNSGNELILDLTGTAPANGQTQPTLLAWTVDPASGGTFTNATGSGTVTISYRRLVHESKRVTSGVATVNFHGLVDTTGLNDVLRF